MARRPPKIIPKKLLVALSIPTVFIPGLLLAVILGWNWQPDLARLGQQGGFYRSPDIFPSRPLVTEVVDGDTFEIDNGLRVRMIGIDAPNPDNPQGQLAKDYFQDLIEGQTVTLEYGRYQDDKFGRLLAWVWEPCHTQWGCRDGQRLLNAVLIHRGHAEYVVYSNRKKLRYDDLLQQALPR